MNRNSFCVLPVVAMDRLEERVAEGTMHVLQSIERQLDQNLQMLNNLDDDDLRRLRIQRLKEVRERANKLQEWRVQGHGWYQEVADQKQWFEEVKTNSRVVCHFYRPTSESCLLLDKHLDALARKHVETRFIKINAEKCPYLSDRLNIVLLPTLVMTKDNFTEDRLEGLDELGGMNFSTEKLERRLAVRGVIDLDAEGQRKGDSTRREEVTEESDEDW